MVEIKKVKSTLASIEHHQHTSTPKPQESPRKRRRKDDKRQKR